MRKYRVREMLGEALAGKRIILAGAKSSQKQLFAQNLAYSLSQTGKTYEVLDGLEHAKEGDYILLFTDAESDGSAAVPQELLGQMADLRSLAPASVLLVSDLCVYGRFFGDTHPRTEEELGYVSHTQSADIPAQRMRLAEHMACRLAREEQIPIKVVRSRRLPKGSNPEQMIAAAVQVLLSGRDGEIYNLPEPEPERANGMPAGDRSGSGANGMSAGDRSGSEANGMSAGDRSDLEANGMSEKAGSISGESSGLPEPEGKERAESFLDWQVLHTDAGKAGRLSC